MSEPEDPWADLYADLGVGNAPPAARPRPAEPADDEPADDEPLADASAEPDAEELDEDGQPKKRRRRRRRRGRKGESASETATDEPDDDIAEPEPLTLDAPVAYDADGEDYDPEAAEPLPDELGSDEPFPDHAEPDDNPPVATRELIADWNVPSWQEIVSGLYRPER